MFNTHIMSSEKWPETPRKLLEARYDAMVSGRVDYLMETHHPDTREQVDRQALEIWSKESKWDGIQLEAEESEGDRAFISFSVRFEKDFQMLTQRERAEFRKSNDCWFYFDSEFLKPDPIRNTARVGRNDPCHCGNGKKFKKCHGAA